jgi:hypothetical protein
LDENVFCMDLKCFERFTICYPKLLCYDLVHSFFEGSHCPKGIPRVVRYLSDCRSLSVLAGPILCITVIVRLDGRNSVVPDKAGWQS